MYTRLAELVAERDLGKVEHLLAISHSRSLAERIGIRWESITEANYPAENILQLGSPDCTFDAVISDQVFEHIEGDPFDAALESIRVLKPGGLLILTTCFLNPVHGSPSDFWRFTPESLRLMIQGRADVIEAGGWGNPAALLAIAAGFRSLPVPNSSWHPAHKLATRNNPAWPVVTWVVARKVGATDV
jgi:SAM-dependent methyltransferase